MPLLHTYAAFRDVLGDNYRSSVTSKTMKRRQERFDKLAKNHIGQLETSKEGAHNEYQHLLRNTSTGRPDPPAMQPGSAGIEGQGPASMDPASFARVGAAENLQRLADISTSLTPYGGSSLSCYPSASSRLGSPVGMGDPGYARYLRDLILRREYSRLNILALQKGNVMNGPYAAYAAAAANYHRNPLERGLHFPPPNFR